MTDKTAIEVLFEDYPLDEMEEEGDED